MEHVHGIDVSWMTHGNGKGTQYPDHSPDNRHILAGVDKRLVWT
jgi:hypothetical protein